MATTSDVEIELGVVTNPERSSEIELSPTTRRHERAFGGKYRLTFSSKRDEWIVRKKQRGRLSTKITDSYKSILSSTYTAYVSSSIRSLLNFFPDYWNYTHLYLIILGITVAIIGAAMDFLTIELSKIHSKIPTQIIWGSHTETEPSLVTLQFIVWLFYSIILVFAAIWVTRKISSTAAGSGLPELKSILSGVYLSEYLSFKTLVAKIIGLCLSAGAGISIGKEGPLVHASAIIANQMSRWVLFERIRNNPSLLQQMLGASCAAGISANLGSPIGGVLFSIEVTSTYFPVRNYWFSFLTSVCGAITYRWVYNKRFGTPWLAALAPTYFTRLEFSFVELFAFFLLGLTCGGLGILFIKMNLYVKRWWVKASEKIPSKWNFYLYALIIIVITNVLTFPKFIGKFMSIDATPQLQDMVYNGELNGIVTNGDDWDKYNLYASLVAAFVVRYVLTAVSIIIPVPCGIFVPLLAAGAIVGRIFGEVLKDIVANDLSYVIIPGGYAVVGAASLLGAITHSLSTAVVLFEITGQIHLLLPMLISVVTSYWVMKKFSTLSLYDSLSREKKLPYLPDLIDGNAETTAKDIMDPKVVVLSEDLKQDDIQAALEATEYKNFPVVLNKESMILVGIIERRILENYVLRVSTMEQEDARTVYSETEGLPGLDMRVGLTITSIPIQVSEDTPLSQIHMLFINLRLFQAYVTKNGKLLGIIKRRRLREVLDEKNSVFTYLNE